MNLLKQVINDDGLVAANVLAKALHITQTDLAKVTGLSRDSVSKRARLKSQATQARLMDTVEILNRVAQWSGGAGRAFAWFRAQPLSSFGDKMAEDLVKEGRADVVKAYQFHIVAMV